jgi:hypothetical protein
VNPGRRPAETPVAVAAPSSVTSSVASAPPRLWPVTTIGSEAGSMPAASPLVAAWATSAAKAVGDDVVSWPGAIVPMLL